MRTIIIIFFALIVVVAIAYLLHSTSTKTRAESNGLQQIRTENFDRHDSNKETLYQQSASSDHPEWPAIESNQTVVSHTGYSLVYDETHEQAIWVAYELTQEETANEIERSDHFSEDPEISSRSATHADYAKSGYDRGHLAPASDMGWSIQAMEESFYYSNMSPQHPSFNRGIWKKLETQVRTWARDHERVYVVTGPVLSEGLPTIGPNEVSVPKYYYKVILDNHNTHANGIGFILPNAPSKQPLSEFAVTIDSVEKVTGINFFPTIPSERIEPLESERCLNCWGL